MKPLQHHFWQIIGLSLALLVAERRWVVAGSLIAAFSFVGGLLSGLP